jgi:hypothetical protein
MSSGIFLASNQNIFLKGECDAVRKPETGDGPATLHAMHVVGLAAGI